MTAHEALYSWSLSLGRLTGLGEPFRRTEALVTSHVGPALRDPVVREHAQAFRIRKWHDPEDSGLDFALVAPREAADTLRGAVDRHLGSQPWRHGASDADPLLIPAFSEYLRGLRELTDIAIDLHCVPDGQLRQHQCFLIRIGCSHVDPRYELHPYLEQHSPAYVRHAMMRRREGQGLWSWAHEEFWARCYTPGPSPEHPAPLFALWNIVVGITPRRWDDPAAVASRLGIECT